MYTKEILFFLQHCTGIAEASIRLRSDAGSVGKHSLMFQDILVFEDKGYCVDWKHQTVIKPWSCVRSKNNRILFFVPFQSHITAHHRMSAMEFIVCSFMFSHCDIVGLGNTINRMFTWFWWLTAGLLWHVGNERKRSSSVPIVWR